MCVHQPSSVVIFITSLIVACYLVVKFIIINNNNNMGSATPFIPLAKSAFNRDFQMFFFRLGSKRGAGPVVGPIAGSATVIF